MAKKPEVPEIEGVKTIDPSTLKGTDFDRFRNDDLYFIDFVTYYPVDGADPDAGRPVERVLAITPFALFITDLEGNMDRATRFEDIQEVFHQKKITKKFFGSETAHHMVLRVPKEADWHISFDITKSGDAKTKELLTTLSAVWVYKVNLLTSAMDTLSALQGGANPSNPSGKKRKLNVTEVESSVDITAKMSREVSREYVPPEEIKRRNREQQMMADRIEQATTEAITLQKQIEDVRQCCLERQQELRHLEGKYGVDHSQLRSQKQLLQQRQAAMHKQVTNGEIELVKLQADVARLREQLDEERANYDQIVNQRVSSAGDTVGQKQHEMMLLRQKAQQKEIAKALAKHQALVDFLAVPPKYEGPPALIQRAEAAESRINDLSTKWCQEMESSNKIDKFLDAINAEITRVSSLISEKNEEKAVLIAKREAFQNAAAQQQASVSASGPAAKDPLLLDDDFANNSSVVAALPTSNRSLPDDDDDLLGSTPAQPKLPDSVHNAGSADPLDDLLASPPPAAKPSEAPNIDDF